MLTDPEGTTSRAYVGIDATDTQTPGIVVVRRDGQIVFRQIAEAKDDRLTAAQLLATNDRTLGTGDGAPVAREGYAVLERLQLRFALGGGRADVEAGGQRSIAVASAGALVPLGRRFLIGPAIRVEPLDVDLAVVMRFPILADADALAADRARRLHAVGCERLERGHPRRRVGRHQSVVGDAARGRRLRASSRCRQHDRLDDHLGCLAADRAALIWRRCADRRSGILRRANHSYCRSDTAF